MQENNYGLFLGSNAVTQLNSRDWTPDGPNKWESAQQTDTKYGKNLRPPNRTKATSESVFPESFCERLVTFSRSTGLFVFVCFLFISFLFILKTLFSYNTCTRSPQNYSTLPQPPLPCLVLMNLFMLIDCQVLVGLAENFFIHLGLQEDVTFAHDGLEKIINPHITQLNCPTPIGLQVLVPLRPLIGIGPLYPYQPKLSTNNFHVTSYICNNGIKKKKKKKKEKTKKWQNLFLTIKILETSDFHRVCGKSFLEWIE